jgi:hypothetical protein
MKPVWLAPLFILFEMAQLMVATRYIGLDQIRSGVHPLDQYPRGPRLLSAAWVAGIFASYAYQVILLFNPQTALPGLLMLATTLAGFGLRRAGGLKYALVVMTFEGSIRAGFLAYAFIAVVVHPPWRGWPGPEWGGI